LGWVGLGWVPGPGAGLAVEAVAEVGFLVVVPGAESGQVVHGGGAALGPGGAVVDFEAVADVAVGDAAGGVSFGEGGAEVGGDGPPGVGDGDDVGSFGEEDLEDGVVGEAAGGSRRPARRACSKSRVAVASMAASRRAPASGVRRRSPR
jgi:hypothetical protein